MTPRRPLSICKVWDAEYPWDVRVEKVARSLRAAGHSVHLAARNRTGLPVLEELPEATVHRLRPWAWVPGPINAASMFPAFFNPRWIRLISRIVRTTRSDLILCRDLPLAVPSVLVGRLHRVPVVLDMAENYPAMMRSLWSAGRARPLDVLTRNPHAVRLIEDWVLRAVDGVLVVVAESGERIRARGVPPDTVALVSNTPPVERLNAPPATHEDDEGPLRLVYLGLLEVPRGVGTLLEAMALLAARRVAASLTIIGGGRDADLLQAQARALGLGEPVVTFRGRLPNPQALEELRQAHVGIIPHWKNESWDTTIPNKLFDYMAAGLPVVSSNTAPVVRIVGGARCGLIFADRSAADLAAQIERLRSAEARRQMADRGRSAVRAEYHWEQDAGRMLDLLDRVARKGSGGPGKLHGG